MKMSLLLKDAAEQIVPVLVALVAYMVADLLKLLHSKRIRIGHKVIKSEEKDRELAVLLAELAIRAGADRSYLAIYHNGDHFVDGSEILRKSRTHEWAADGVSYEADKFQNVLVSLMPEESKFVHDTPSWAIMSSLEECRFKHLLRSGRVIAFARQPIKKNGKDTIGFLGLDFTRTTEKPEKIDDLMQEYAWRVQECFSRHKN
jgi:hypothetical protein